MAASLTYQPVRLSGRFTPVYHVANTRSWRPRNRRTACGLKVNARRDVLMSWCEEPLITCGDCRLIMEASA